MVSTVEIRVAFALFLLRATVVDTDERDCSLMLPTDYGSGRVYTSVFRWKKPHDSYGNSRTYIRHGDMITLTCPGGFVKEDLTDESYVVQCMDGKLNGSFFYEDLMCTSDFHRHTKVERIRDLKSNLFDCSGEQWELYQVSVRKRRGKYKDLYVICFDTVMMRPKFALQYPRNEVPTKSEDMRKDVWGLNYFGKTAYEKLKLSNGYVVHSQRARITNAFPNRYNRNRQYPYTFDRGHLAPYTDFVQANDKKASCLYINVAPQWVDLDRYTWTVVERMARDLVKDDPKNWEVYTGTYGIIPTERGPLCLSPFFDEHGRFVQAFVPVPRLYWKVLYNKVSRVDSRVFVGVNNPELKSPDEFANGYLVCKPKLLRNGAHFMGNEFKGFAYECELEEFVEVLTRDEGLTMADTDS